MMRMFAAVSAAAIALTLANASPSAAKEPQNRQAAGWGAMDCNGHTHLVWGPTWLAPNHRMQAIFIQDRDHDNFTPLKLTVNKITITKGEGCGKAPDSNFPTTAAEQPVGGVVSTAVQVRASACRGPRVYDINVTCEHDGSCSNGGVCPAIETRDLLVTVGGKRPAPKDPFTPKPE